MNTGHPDDVIAQGFELNIKRSDLRLLKDGEWLNDEVTCCLFVLFCFVLLFVAVICHD
jgi:hypothetical protein